MIGWKWRIRERYEYGKLKEKNTYKIRSVGLYCPVCKCTQKKRITLYGMDIDYTPEGYVKWKYVYQCLNCGNIYGDLK